MVRKISLIILLLFIVPLFAHDYWLQPEKFILAKGDTLAVHLYVGDELKVDIERPLQKNMTPRFELHTPDGIIDLRSLQADSVQPVVKRAVDFVGQGLLVMNRDFAFIELTPEQFSDYLRHEGLEEIEALRAKMDKRTKERERYARFIKSLIQVDKNNQGELYNKVVGQKLEIVLLQNPFLAKPGDELAAKILFEGKPLPDKSVMALYKDQQGQVKVFKSITNKNGVAQFKLTGPGMWVIRLVHLLPCKGCNDVDWESFWASYSFWIK